MQKYISRFLIACYFIIVVNHALASDEVAKPLPQWQVFSYGCFTPLQLSILNAKLFSGETPVYGANLNFGFGNSQKSVSGITLGVVNYEFGIHNGIILGGFNYCDKNNGVAFGCFNEFKENNGIAVACLINASHDDDGIGSIAPLNCANDRIFQIGIMNAGNLLRYSNKPIFQCGIFFNVALRGLLQIGTINCCDQNMLLEVGFFNGTRKNDGLQIGFTNAVVNHNDEVSNGCQAGIFNFVEGGNRGLQIGFYNDTSGCERRDNSNKWQIGFFNITEHDGVQLGLSNYNKNALIPWLPLFNFSSPPSSDKTEGEKK